MDMGFPAARLFTDKVVGFPHCHVPGHPPGPPIPTPILGVLIYPDPLSLVFGRPTVFINNLPAAVLGDPGFHVFCCGPNKFEISTGSSTVNIEGERAARAIDFTKHCDMGMPAIPPVIGNRGMIVSGSPNVLIGGLPLPDFFAIGLGLAFKGLAKVRNLAKAGKLGKKAEKGLREASAKIHAAAAKITKRLPNRARNMVHSAICTVTGHPVDIASGKVITSEIDFRLPGPIPLVFQRSYNSTFNYNKYLGFGWTHNLDMTIKIIKNKDEMFIVFKNNEGREIDFDYIQIGKSVYNRIEKLLLFRTDDGFVLLDGKMKLFFDFLIKVDIYLLTQIEDSTDGVIQIRYNSLGSIETVIDSTGRELWFKYNNSLLVAIFLKSESSINKENLPLVSFEYDENNLVKVEHGLEISKLYKYNNHLLVTETNSNGYSYYFKYNEKNYCIETWGEDGQAYRKLTYDTKKRETTEIRSNGRKIIYKYNIFGVVETQIDEFEGYKSTQFIEWDDNMNQISYTDQNGNTTKWVYDEDNILIKVVDPNNNTINYIYDENKNLIEIIDPCGYSWKIEYDLENNIKLFIDPLNRKTKIKYDMNGNIILIVNPMGNIVQTNQYDKFGNIIKKENNIGVTEYMYDYLGRIIEKTDYHGRKFKFNYDSGWHVARIIKSNKSLFQNGYDNEDNLLIHQKMDGKTIEYIYDKSNRLKKHTDGAKNEIKYEYDLEGNILSITDEEGNSSLLYYDPLDRLIKHKFVDGRMEEYYYDPAGRLVKTKDNLTEIRYEHDRNGNIIRRISNEEETFYKYDELNRTVFAKNNNVILTYAYDKLGRLETETQNDFVSNYFYNERDNQTELSLSNGRKIVYKYDKSDQLIAIDDSLCGHHEFLYLFGLLKMHKFPNGIITRYEYDEHDRLVRQEISHPINGKIQSRDYKYDLAGNIIKYSDYMNKYEYKYNAQNFLTLERTNSDVSNNLYDKAGNILKNKNYDSMKYSQNRLMSSDDTIYKYDENGNIIEKITGSKNTKFEYNSDNMLVSIKFDDESQILYRYDPYGRRLFKDNKGVKTFYYWNKDNLICEENDVVTHYLYLPGTFVPIACNDNGKLFFYHCDLVGVPKEISNSRGEIEELVSIDTLGFSGETKSKTPFRFLGQYYDTESGLNYNRFRYYDPKIGRFISPDPIGLEGGLNTYIYGTNPFRSVDPLGLSAVEIYAANRAAAHRKARERGEIPRGLQPSSRGTFGPPGPKGGPRGNVPTTDPASVGRWEKYEWVDADGIKRERYIVEHDYKVVETKGPGGKTQIEYQNDPHFHVAENKPGELPLEEGGTYKQYGPKDEAPNGYRHHINQRPEGSTPPNKKITQDEFDKSTAERNQKLKDMDIEKARRRKERSEGEKK